MLALNDLGRSDHTVESVFRPRTKIQSDGTVEGYASLFGEVDQARDMVMPGAFAQTLKLRSIRRVPMLFQHDPAEPIGRWRTIREDERGLYVEGVLSPGVARAREVLNLMKSGALDGLSIGFQTVRSRTDRTSGVRRILEADLWEISIVTFPMLPSARVSNVKNARWFRDRETELVRTMRRATNMASRSLTGAGVARIIVRCIAGRSANVHSAVYSPARAATRRYESPSCRRKLRTAASGARPTRPSRSPVGLSQDS